MQMTLKAARINVGYTQEQAAEKIGVSSDTISNWERGKCFPGVPMLKQIEKVYGVPYNDIIFLNS